jgi:hypothetical protein
MGSDHILFLHLSRRRDETRTETQAPSSMSETENSENDSGMSANNYIRALGLLPSV